MSESPSGVPAAAVPLPLPYNELIKQLAGGRRPVDLFNEAQRRGLPNLSFSTINNAMADKVPSRTAPATETLLSWAMVLDGTPMPDPTTVTSLWLGAGASRDDLRNYLRLPAAAWLLHPGHEVLAKQRHRHLRDAARRAVAALVDAANEIDAGIEGAASASSSG